MKSEAFPSIARKAGTVKNLVRAAAFALCFSASWATPQHAFADVLRIGVSQPIDSLNPSSPVLITVASHINMDTHF